jgi:hypothetical protein
MDSQHVRFLFEEGDWLDVISSPAARLKVIPVRTRSEVQQAVPGWSDRDAPARR